MGEQVQKEQRKMLEAHQSARERDRLELERARTQIENDSKFELAKELKRMKEILTQEYEFKTKNLEETHTK